MANCLGIYIENNLIKYAKVSKNNEKIKVETFGIKFYETIGTALKQIIEETYSFKEPISINTTNEWYNEIQVFSLLSQNDIKHAIKTEFENICDLKGINQNLYEQRNFFTNSYKGNDKLDVLHIAVPKTYIEQRKNQFKENKINAIIPLGVSIANLINKSSKGSSLIVNIEEDTTITKITNGVVCNVEIIEAGMQEILEKINHKENSFFKSYEVCKSATIYTESDKDLQYEENEYLEDIMPTLYQVLTKVQKTVETSMESIEKIYITGTGAIINNIDIYFQDYFKGIHCEILKPSFLDNNSKINIKDYIEVNSAISLAIEGLEKNNKLNFKAEPTINKLSEFSSFMKSDISNIKNTEVFNGAKDALENFQRPISFTAVLCMVIAIVYFSGICLINNGLNNKIAEVDDSILNTKKRIAAIKEYNSKFNSQTSKYETLIKNIQNLNNANSENRRYRNTIPNLLNNIMSVIPRKVQLISIQNTSGTHILIKARAYETQQIAYFKTKLKEEAVLKNVISDTGISEGGYLIVTIEGELP